MYSSSCSVILIKLKEEVGWNLSRKRNLDLDKIVEEATILIGTEGLAKTTLPSLAKVLDVRSQSLYHYVANRHQLFSLVAASRIKLLHQQLVEQLMGLSGTAALLKFADVTRAFVLKDTALGQILYHFNEYQNDAAINDGISSIIKLGQKFNLSKQSTVSPHALIGAVLGYVFFDRSAAFADEDPEEANHNYHQMILRLVDPAASLQEN